jgi:hypothetical protein
MGMGRKPVKLPAKRTEDTEKMGAGFLGGGETGAAAPLVFVSISGIARRVVIIMRPPRRRPPEALAELY